jgi:hypothetical protein
MDPVDPKRLMRVIDGSWALPHPVRWRWAKKFFENL